MNDVTVPPAAVVAVYQQRLAEETHRTVLLEAHVAQLTELLQQAHDRLEEFAPKPAHEETP